MCLGSADLSDSDVRACALSGYLVKAVGLDVNSVDHAQRTPVYMAAANGKVRHCRQHYATS